MLHRLPEKGQRQVLDDDDGGDADSEEEDEDAWK